MYNIDVIKRIRKETGAGLNEIKTALEESKWDYEKAMAVLRGRQNRDRKAVCGRIETYNHNGRIAAMVEINCETDFVANTPDFKKMAKEVAMQIASMNPGSVKDLLAQDYIRDSHKTVADLVNECATVCDENIVVSRFQRYELGYLYESNDNVGFEWHKAEPAEDCEWIKI